MLRQKSQTLLGKRDIYAKYRLVQRKHEAQAVAPEDDNISKAGFVGGGSGLGLLLLCIILLHSFGVDKATDPLLLDTLEVSGMVVGSSNPHNLACSWKNSSLVDAPSEIPGSVSTLLSSKGRRLNPNGTAPTRIYLHSQAENTLPYAFKWLVSTC